MRKVFLFLYWLFFLFPSMEDNFSFYFNPLFLIVSFLCLSIYYNNYVYFIGSLFGFLLTFTSIEFIGSGDFLPLTVVLFVNFHRLNIYNFLIYIFCLNYFLFLNWNIKNKKVPMIFPILLSNFFLKCF